MHWWHSAFSSSQSSSSSSSSSSRRQADDGYLFKLGRSLRFQQRRNSRHRKLPDLNDGSDLWRSSSDLDRVSAVQSPSSSSAGPQPLPLPELSLLFRRDAPPASSSRSNSSAGNVPLPSPKEAAIRGGEEREKAADASIGTLNAVGVAANSGIGRISNQDVHNHTEYAETRIFENGHREVNGVERIQDHHRFNVLSSAPTSPLSSPARSPHRLSGDMFTSHYMNPQAFQVWSAPEMPPLDMNLGVGFPYRISSEKTAFSVDSSPLHSPRQSIKIPSGPPSPLHNRLSHEMAIGRRESNAQGNVHPLPLPPGAASSPPRSSLLPIAKQEMVPMKSQWQKGKLLGRGTFGSVYVATNRETGALCAMKEVEIITDDPRSAECIKQLQQEIKILSQLKHPNIVQYYGSEIVGDKFHIYLEYVHPGSINKYVHEHCGAMTESVVRNFTRHILSGLAYLHSTRTIHRDIKGANLLVDAYGVVKLADFGMSKHLNGQMSHLSLKGSPHWMAPELLQSVMQKDTTSDAALAVDIWSLGCTIIEMLNGKPPWSEYEGAAAMFKVLRECPPIPESLSPEGKDFLRCCFRRNPAERPSACILLEHRFLRNSLQLEVPSFSQALSGMKVADKQWALRERPNYMIDRLPLSPESLATRGKLVNNFIHDSFSPVQRANDPSVKLPI